MLFVDIVEREKGQCKTERERRKRQKGKRTSGKVSFFVQQSDMTLVILSLNYFVFKIRRKRLHFQAGFWVFCRPEFPSHRFQLNNKFPSLLTAVSLRDARVQREEPSRVRFRCRVCVCFRVRLCVSDRAPGIPRGSYFARALNTIKTESL